MRAMARERPRHRHGRATSSLTSDQAERLHQTMRRLRQMGRTILYVSHFLDHVLDICDRVTVMRDGLVVRTSDARAETKVSLVAAMLGRANAEVSFPEKAAPPARAAPPLLRVEKLSAATGVSDVDLEVHAGEIVG